MACICWLRLIVTAVSVCFQTCRSFHIIIAENGNVNEVAKFVNRNRSVKSIIRLS